MRQEYIGSIPVLAFTRFHEKPPGIGYGKCIYYPALENLVIQESDHRPPSWGADIHVPKEHLVHFDTYVTFRHGKR